MLFVLSSLLTAEREGIGLYGIFEANVMSHSERQPTELGYSLCIKQFTLGLEVER
jgi:hypothetical protein